MHTKKILFAAALLTVLAACSSDDQSSEPMEQLTPVTLQYTTIDATETRAAQDLNQGTFASGETVKVRISNTGAGSWTDYDFTTGDAGAMIAPATPPYYPAGSQNIDIVAYYPAAAGTSFSVATDQTSDADYKASDLMFASVTNQAKQADAVNLAFSHKMAKLCVNVTAGTGVGSINSVSILNVKPTISFNQATGAVGSASGDATTIAMTNNGAAVIPAQTIDGGLLSITTDKGTATYTVSNKAFESGKVYTINLTVNLRAVGTTNAITGWTSEGTVTVDSERPNIAGHEYVDMGTVTIGGEEKNLKWATCNMGAYNPWEYGDYYAWGATAPQTRYDWANYPFMEEGQSTLAHITKYTHADSFTTAIWYDGGGNFIGDGKSYFADYDYADDAARQRWGVTWRIPTDEEWTALRNTDLYTWVWTTDYLGSGKKGMLVTRKADTGPCSGNSIFLPAAGNRYNRYLDDAGSYGDYWSSSLNTDYSVNAWYVGFGSDGVIRYDVDRFFGFSLRPVSD